MNERRGGLRAVTRGVVDAAISSESKALYRDMGWHLYGVSRWVLASVLHPIATFKAVMLIGDQETINRNVDHALSLPKLPFPRGGQRLQ